MPQISEEEWRRTAFRVSSPLAATLGTRRSQLVSNHPLITFRSWCQYENPEPRVTR